MTDLLDARELELVGFDNHLMWMPSVLNGSGRILNRRGEVVAWHPKSCAIEFRRHVSPHKFCVLRSLEKDLERELSAGRWRGFREPPFD